MRIKLKSESYYESLSTAASSIHYMQSHLAYVVSQESINCTYLQIRTKIKTQFIDKMSDISNGPIIAVNRVLLVVTDSVGENTLQQLCRAVNKEFNMQFRVIRSEGRDAG